MTSFVQAINDFHFLRPAWLLLLPILVYFSYWLKLHQQTQTGLESWIDHHLLSYLRVGQSKHSTRPYYALGVIWLTICIALAGPVWQQRPQILHSSDSALVIMLDLSPSMNAEDNKPSRIVRARLKIQDLLNQRREGLTALVAYAGEAHIVAPLTDDIRTIENLLPTLAPGLLPIPGSNIEMAVSSSQKLLIDSGIDQATFVIVTDGIAPAAFSTIKQSLNPNIDVFILGVGTTKGAPIPTRDGFLRDNKEQIIQAKRNDKELQDLANAIGAHFIPLRADKADIQYISENITHPQDNMRELERQMDQWEEFGPTLLLFILPLAAFAFRRGYLLTIGLSLLPLLYAPPGYTWSLEDLWKTPDQQGQEAFEREEYSQAQQQFAQPQWRGSAAYRNQDYQAAAKAFAEGDSASDHYNRGNALAKLQQWDKAIAAYDEALKRDPNLKDAKVNRQLVEEFKRQQSSQQQEDSNSSQSGDNSQQDPSDEKQGESSNRSEQNSEQSSDASQASDNTEKESGQQEKNSAEQEADEQEADKASEPNKPSTTENNEHLAHLNKEEKQALEQWIRKIPDDPSGLLRRKFEYEFQKRRQAYQQGEWELPDNNAHQRY